jgi:hypothetical protein
MCKICEKEVFITYEQSKADKTAKDIREAMEQGDVWKFDLGKYVEEHYPELVHSAP